MVADEYDVLAAVVRFASVKERSFAFYQKHRLAVDAALEFINTLRSESREMGMLLSGSGDPVQKTAAALRKRVGDLRVSTKAQSLVDGDAQDLIAQMEPMLADTSRPAYLDECRWIVKSCALKAAMPAVLGFE
ncbi:MAG: hypothetical protein JWO94_3780 [Verrucomicrobiaceae bacterium]|nr:hypothetical protein [Verrucomicrobiaceae bacterium]